MVKDLYHEDDSSAAVEAFEARSAKRKHLTVPPMAPDAHVIAPLFTNKKK